MTKTQVIDKVLDIAVDEIGYLEKESNSKLDDKEANAGNKNFTKYARDCFPELQGLSWCCMFIWWIFEEAFGKFNAEKILGTKTAKCSYLMDYMNKIPIEEADIGDIVFFKNAEGNVSHIGIIDYVVGDDIWTIEGNTTRKSENEVVTNGGGVFSRYYNRYNPRIACIGRPLYELLATEMEQPKQEVNAEVIGYNVNVRSGAGTEHRRIGQVSKGYQFKIISKHEDTEHKNREWYKFQFNSDIGFICADYVKRI